MATPWQTLVSQKLYLAKTLLATEGRYEQPAEREAVSQGSVELMLRARQLLLAMVADLYQHRNRAPEDLEALAELIGNEAPEYLELDALSHQSDSWWNILQQLDAGQKQPPAKQKTVSADNIIAVSAASGPDRSAPTLIRVIDAMRQFSDTVAERHHEW